MFCHIVELSISNPFDVQYINFSREIGQEDLTERYYIEKREF